MEVLEGKTWTIQEYENLEFYINELIGKIWVLDGGMLWRNLDHLDIWRSKIY
jgi:hypothetical protein